MLVCILTFRATCLIKPFDSSVQIAGTVKTQRMSDVFGSLKKNKSFFITFTILLCYVHE